jgi:hypothetical protein
MTESRRLPDRYDGLAGLIMEKSGRGQPIQNDWT